MTRNRAAIHGFVDATLRGTPDSDIDRDAVMQEALLRAWREWLAWPAADARRQAYPRRVLRLAALDAIRTAYGRDGRRPRVLAIALAGLERCDGDASPTAAEINRTLARQVTSHTTDVEDRIVLAAALTALTELERRAVLLSAQGITDREVAGRLNVTRQRARTVLMDARALRSGFTDHAARLDGLRGRVAAAGHGHQQAPPPPAAPSPRALRHLPGRADTHVIDHDAACPNGTPTRPARAPGTARLVPDGFGRPTPTPHPDASDRTRSR